MYPCINLSGKEFSTWITFLSFCTGPTSLLVAPVSIHILKILAPNYRLMYGNRDWSLKRQWIIVTQRLSVLFNFNYNFVLIWSLLNVLIAPFGLEVGIALPKLGRRVNFHWLWRLSLLISILCFPRNHCCFAVSWSSPLLWFGWTRFLFTSFPALFLLWFWRMKHKTRYARC